VPALLEVEDLSVVYEGDRRTIPILDSISLKVDGSQTVGIVGESGSGKSVLLTAILGLLPPHWHITSGSIRLAGQELRGSDERALGKIRGKQLGLALANPRQHLNPILSVGRQLANVIRSHEPQPLDQAFSKAVDLLHAVGIPDPVGRLQAYPHELSGGMCQRVILALAIANAPRLLMVDEPTSGLDVTISVQILDLLRESVRNLGSGLVLVSRDLGVVAHYCERVAVMRSGRIVEEAPVRSFFAAPRELYSQQLLRAAAAARDADLTIDAPDGASEVSQEMAAPVLELAGLIKRFPVKGGRQLTAVNDVSFTIRRGEAVALVGESGSGKTTVGRCILRLLDPSEGTVFFKGKDVTLLSRDRFRQLRSRIQMVFQDPFDSMDPRQRIGDAIAEPIRLTGSATQAERRARVDELLELVGLTTAASNLYPHQMSAGELQRVGIARAIATDPDLIVFDEPTSALDVSVRAEILKLLHDLQRRLGIAYLFISHDLTAVRRLCHRTAILYLGKLVEIGETESLFEAPMHPYSRALLSSVLYPDPEQVRSPFALTGEIPSPIDLPPGCPLHTRCPMATEHCSQVSPPLEEKTPGRRLSCLNVPALSSLAAQVPFEIQEYPYARRSNRLVGRGSARPVDP
jgi:peptide/nickel transport system ATP-binding protein